LYKLHLPAPDTYDYYQQYYHSMILLNLVNPENSDKPEVPETYWKVWFLWETALRDNIVSRTKSLKNWVSDFKMLYLPN